MRYDKRFLLLQINDALFPVGGYSHSYGLETYIQMNKVYNEETALEYSKHNIRYTYTYTDLLGVRLAYKAACDKDLTSIQQIELIMEISKTPSEIRSASLKLGSRFIKTLRGLEITYESTIFSEYMKPGNTGHHHAIAYGVFCAAIGLEYEEMLVNYLYAQTSAMVTNLVKTIPLSQTVGQRLLVEVMPVMEQAILHVAELTLDDFCLSMPGFDIRCMQHEGLYSRLYMS